MDTAISSQQTSTHIPAPHTGLKPCQRSCRGLLLYFPPSPTAVNRENPYSWRSNEPVCLGLSAARKGPNLDLKKLHEARAIPPEQHVDFSLVLGHAVYQANIDTKVLPPGCMTGLEFLRFCKTPSMAAANTASATTASGLDRGLDSSAPSVSSSADTSTAAPQTTFVQSTVNSITRPLKAFASGFRILTSDADTNARLSKTWTSLVEFDPQQYAAKFETHAQKNFEAMSKWLRDLQNAVSKPKA
ncbi:hypothetical protein PLESTB_000638900 [Pleodorina starrii]|uniref:Uncharacterized protein n=1 Tax=Pleodorina starrii TaxID=330485 RepID=A0A9W6BJE7_9CHLO|nr:hypothetical protein PLESTM_001300300 [Pleodorina starrii]GLC52521.1 hypothetical protein PLESTB_000638900 [Pleodorina starrii]GLC71521.1 hypothetical protein PLESTF_001131000 [Pleodorina starrii]